MVFTVPSRAWEDAALRMSTVVGKTFNALATR